jgi:hypothetical protein
MARTPLAVLLREQDLRQVRQYRWMEGTAIPVDDDARARTNAAGPRPWSPDY